MTYGNASISHPRPRFLQQERILPVQYNIHHKENIYVYRCNVNICKSCLYIYIHAMVSYTKNERITFIFAVNLLIYLPIERINRPIAIKMVAGWLQQPTSMQLPTSGSCSSFSEGELSSLLHLLYYQAPPCHECDECRRKTAFCYPS